MIRFATIGTNWITEAFIRAAKQVPSFHLQAVYSRQQETANAFAEKTGATETFTNLHELAASKNVDAVYIASPNAFHAEQAITLMNHGKHVICENRSLLTPKKWKR